MSDLTAIIAIICYLFIIIFGTHYIRTWAFSRYEAVTFECSAVAVLLALGLLWRYGPSLMLVLTFIALLIMFIAISFAQWHFYMILQGIIREAFSKRAEYLRKHDIDPSVNDTLLTMASVAIMPSFSRFIEESKIFNNPGGFIGLVKSIMKRQRFQKKKYQMRECFADNVNLIGPCKPEIDSMMADPEHFIPGAIHANDLALDYPDEKKGLFSFDILGFGAMAVIGVVYILVYLNYSGMGMWDEATPLKTIVMLISALLFTVLSHVLRHFAFARYESITYELSFTALAIASFRVMEGILAGDGLYWYNWLVPGLAFVIFIVKSYANRRLDKSLHKRINDKYDDILYQTPLETETDRTKRRFLQNLKTISEWSVVPYPGSRRRSAMYRKLMWTDKLREFEDINARKQDMPGLVEGLIDRIVPEFSRDVMEADFKLPARDLQKSRTVNTVLGTLAVVGVFVCMMAGLI